MNNPYEMVVLYHPDLEIDLDKPLKKVEKILADNKGKVTKQDNWGKRKLAYPIRKEDHAIYVYYEIELPTEAIAGIESSLNITDEVLRYLIVKPGPEIEEEEDNKKEQDSKKSADKSEDKETDDKEEKPEEVKEDKKDEEEKPKKETKKTTKDAK